MKTTGRSILPALLALAFASGPSPDARAGEIEVKALNRGPSGVVFVFAPELVRIEPGDSINFVATDKGHEVHSVPGMIPEGAQLFEGRMNQDVKVSFTVPGVYVVSCRPHTAMGMVAVVSSENLSTSTNRFQAHSRARPGQARESPRPP